MKKTPLIFLLVVSTPLKNISQNGNLPQIVVKIKNLFETTQLLFSIESWMFNKDPYLGLLKSLYNCSV